MCHNVLISYISLFTMHPLAVKGIKYHADELNAKKYFVDDRLVYSSCVPCLFYASGVKTQRMHLCFPDYSFSSKPPFKMR